MVAASNFIFKGMKKREAGKFTTKEGKEVQYDEAYFLKFDEVKDDAEIFERKVKVDINDIELINKLKNFNLYQRIILYFEINFWKDNTAIIKLVDAFELQKDKESEDINEQQNKIYLLTLKFYEKDDALQSFSNKII